MHLKIEPIPTAEKNVSRLTDFIMFTQHSFLLNLSKGLNEKSVSFSQFFLLGYLARGHCLTMKELSAKIGRSGAASTTLVDRLEKSGYLRRITASTDRRFVMVQITRKGTELVQHMRGDIEGDVLDKLGGTSFELPEPVLQMAN